MTTTIRWILFGTVLAAGIGRQFLFLKGKIFSRMTSVMMMVSDGAPVDDNALTLDV